MSFAELVQFVKEESDLANDPVLSPDVLKRERKGLETTKDYRGKGQNKADSFAISTIQEQFPLCKGTHPLTKCREFKKKRVEERREFVKTKDLCFGCLKSGGKPHPTLFHNSVQTAKRPQRNSKQRNSDSQAKNLPIAATYASITSGSTSLPDVGTTTSMIVLVVVHHMDRPQVEVSVYALLDDESDSIRDKFHSQGAWTRRN